jgi:peptidoglycan/LPS O-acetylase OafA/YrhL
VTTPRPTPEAATPPAGASLYIPTLDGWRALSIAAVLVHHQLSLVLPEGARPRGDPLQIGVAVFFALSGLLITTLLINERRRRGSINLRNFYRRRVFRILPPALVYLAVLWILTRQGIIEVPGRSFIACLTFWRYRFMGDWYTGHFWSLSMEEQFYLLWPAILVLTVSLRAGRAACAALLALFTVWASLQGRYLPAPGGEPNYWALFILWGSLAALVVSEEPVRERLRRWSGTWTTLAVLALTVFAYFRQPNLPGRRVVVPVSIALLLLTTTLKPESLASRFLENPILRWLGRLSYSLYLWQQLFLVSSLWPYPFPLDVRAHAYLPMLAALACATASRYLVEKPCIALGQRLARASPRALAEAGR